MQATLASWIADLPEDVLDNHAELDYVRGVVALRERRMGEAAAFLDRAAQVFETRGDAAALARVLPELAEATLFAGQLDRAFEVVGRALAQPLPNTSRIALLLDRCRNLVFQGRPHEAIADAVAAFDVYDEDPSVDATLELFTRLVLGIVSLPGVLDRAEAACESAERRFPSPGQALELVLAEQWTIVHLFRARPDAAAAAARRALELGAQLGGLVPWRTWTTRGNLVTASTLHGETVDLEPLLKAAQVPGLHPRFLLGVLLFIGVVAWKQRDFTVLRSVNEWHREAVGLSGPMAQLVRGIFDGLVGLASGLPVAAIAALEPAVEIERRLPGFNFLCSARACLTLAYRDAGRSVDARRVFDEALADLDRKGAPGVILSLGPAMIPLLEDAVARESEQADLARRTLRAYGVDPDRDEASRSAGGRVGSIEIPGSGQWLTEREAQVLRLIAAGASNREIADTLVITERTVKSHTTQILAKLDVDSRARAAARARELRLIKG
jgi:DNA-binding CsgD family transcriptional regulator/tetratricopeptide (TPR) repeat protein